MGEARKDAMKLAFDHRLKLESYGTKVSKKAQTLIHVVSATTV